MIRRPPRSTRTDTLFPYTTLFRSMERLTGDLGQRRVLDLDVPLITLQVMPGRNLEVLTEAATRMHILRSEEHTSELQSLMRISYAVFCLKKKKITKKKKYSYNTNTAEHVSM